MIFGRIKGLNVGSVSWVKWCNGTFDRLDDVRKWAVLLTVIVVLFIGWHAVLQSALAVRLERNRARVYGLETDEAATLQQIERFKRLRAENKLVSASEYRDKMSGRTTISAGLGQWGEQYGLRLESSEQKGDELVLRFEGNYPATMKFFEQLANEADGLVALRGFEYRALSGQSAASIKLQVVLGR